MHQVYRRFNRRNDDGMTTLDRERERMPIWNNSSPGPSYGGSDSGQDDDASTRAVYGDVPQSLAAYDGADFVLDGDAFEADSEGSESEATRSSLTLCDAGEFGNGCDCTVCRPCLRQSDGGC